MPLRISNTTTDISVLNRWAEEIESKIKKATTTANSAFGALNAPPGTSTVVANFGKLTTGTNTDATMIVDSGATLKYTNKGVVNANEIGGILVSGNTPSHVGQLLISQPGNATAVWADPLVQGLQTEGTSTTGLNPVLIGGKDSGGNLKDLNLDAAGNIQVSISDGSNTVLQDILFELRGLRKLMMLVYAESGQGEATSLLTDSTED